MPWESPLHTAARHGKLETVLTLLTNENINSKSDWGYTPLNCAAYGGHTEIMDTLLHSGADVNIHNGEGWTPLHAACQQGQVAAVKLLLENGAKSCVNVSCRSNHTPLFVACKSKLDLNGDIVTLLVNAGADVNTRNSHNRTPLMEACSKGLKHKVEILLKSGADVSAVDDAGLSALHMAVPFVRIVRRLVDAGAEVNLKDHRSEIPLQRRNINVRAIRIFLEWGAGADIPCSKHKRCKGSIVQCLGKTASVIAKKRVNYESWITFDCYFIASEIAGLNSGRGNLFVEPPENLNYWYTSRREDYRVECETELVLMKTVKIPGTNSTYSDVLYQRPYALRNVSGSTLEHCRNEFHIYGEMIWSRFIIGRRKLSLIDECIDFFSLTELPHLPSECVAEILSYLPEHDLKNVVAVCNLCANASMKPESNKRPNPDASLQVMKFLRVN